MEEFACLLGAIIRQTPRNHNKDVNLLYGSTANYPLLAWSNRLFINRSLSNPERLSNSTHPECAMSEIWGEDEKI
ncbi:MAG: hypothetical protein AAFV59_00075 [Pseudomonadota bacterium]